MRGVVRKLLFRIYALHEYERDMMHLVAFLDHVALNSKIESISKGFRNTKVILQLKFKR